MVGVDIDLLLVFEFTWCRFCIVVVFMSLRERYQANTIRIESCFASHFMSDLLIVLHLQLRLAEIECSLHSLRSLHSWSTHSCTVVCGSLCNLQLQYYR